jgi:hypothetical protein
MDGEKRKGDDGYAPQESKEQDAAAQEPVKIVNESKKPFLGGFKHKQTGLVYHHAEIQTFGRPADIGKMAHRETQTIKFETRSQQTTREFGTQMSRPDLYVDTAGDKVLTPGVYFSADELASLKDVKAKEVQCFLRQCFAFRRVRRLREERDEKQQADSERAADAEHREMQLMLKRKEQRSRPRTKADFEALQKELEVWRQKSTDSIKNANPPLSSEEQAFKLEELLSKEVKLLQTIDRLKIVARRENAKTKTTSTLEKMASPNEWIADGQKIEVVTPYTVRSRELVDLFNGLRLATVTEAERMDVLLNVKFVVQEFDCELTRDIVELVAREEDMLRRGRSSKSLEGLRQRLANLFLQFLNTPEFNPQAADYQSVPYATVPSRMPIQHSFILPPRKPLASTAIQP